MWSTLTITQREELVRVMARQGLTDSQIEASLGAPDGAVRTLARRLSVVLQSEKQRKAAEAEPDAGPVGHGPVWALDEDKRRRSIAKRASKAATEALRAFQ